MSAKPRDLGMTPLDDLFSTDESRAEAHLEKVVTLNPADISDFPNHPFKVKQDEAMAEMVDSVKQYGVLVPALVRPKADGGYEMVAGHRRKCAATLAGITEMPCIVRNLSDDEATIIMVDSNLQRETILPSEKAFAYKMKLEAMKRQAGRPSKENLRPLDTNLIGTRSDEQLAKDSPDSARQIQRYIRLTELVPDLQKMVDEKQLSFTPAVEISFIRPRHQKYIAVAIEGQASSPSLSQAQKMRELDKEGKLNGDVIDGILSEQKKEVDKVIINSTELEKYFGKDKTPREMKDTILALLDKWKEKQPPELGKPDKKKDMEK